MTSPVLVLAKVGAAILAVLFVCLISPYAGWLRRKIRAKVHGRVGPPWWQEYADLVKLLFKEDLMPVTASYGWFTLMPALTFALALALPVTVYPIFHSLSDLILIAYMLLMVSVMLVFAGYASNNPYSIVGSRRALLSILMYELPFVMVLISIFVLTRSTNIFDIINWQTAHGPLIMYLPLGAAAFIMCIPIKAILNPFSIATAETELMEGVLLEYSGRRLALLEFAHKMEFYILALLFAIVFTNLPYFSISAMATNLSLAACWVLWTIFISLIVVIVCSFVDALTARLQPYKAPKVYWIIATVLSVVNLIVACILSATVLR